MPRKTEKEWYMTDHICRKPGCQGRILKAVVTGMSPGGNPLFRCSSCGKSSHGMDTGSLCWCGSAFKGQPEGAMGMRCERTDIVKQLPWMKEAFENSGFHLYDGGPEIGVVSRFAAREAERNADNK